MEQWQWTQRSVFVRWSYNAGVHLRGLLAQVWEYALSLCLSGLNETTIVFVLFLLVLAFIWHILLLVVAGSRW